MTTEDERLQDKMLELATGFMWEKLRKHTKDRGSSWKDDSIRALFNRLVEEVHELDQAISEEAVQGFFSHRRRVVDEATDVANFAAMIIDLAYYGGKVAHDNMAPMCEPEAEPQFEKGDYVYYHPTEDSKEEGWIRDKVPYDFGRRFVYTVATHRGWLPSVRPDRLTKRNRHPFYWSRLDQERRKTFGSGLNVEAIRGRVVRPEALDELAAMTQETPDGCLYPNVPPETRIHVGIDPGVGESFSYRVTHNRNGDVVVSEPVLSGPGGDGGVYCGPGGAGVTSGGSGGRGYTVTPGHTWSGGGGGGPLTPEERESLTGRKDDSDKPRFDLIPPLALEAVARVLTHGAKKYAPENWRKVEGWRWRYFAAAMRHLWAYKRGEWLDPDSGEPHLAHVLCCIMFLEERETEERQ